MRVERALALLVLCGAAGCASVEEPKLPLPLSADAAASPLTRVQCVEFALRSVPTAAAWRARLDQAHAALASAQRLPNPTLALNFEDLGLGGGAGVPVQTTVMLGEALADLASRGRRSAAAQHELAAEEARLLAERADLAASVSLAYDELVAARGRLELDRDLSRIAESQQQAVARFVELGEAPRLELEKAQAERLDAGLQSAHDEAAARAKEIELAFALGFERPVALQLAEGLGGPLADEASELETLLALAAQRSPRLKAASESYAAQLERAHLAASAVRFLPVVRAGPRSVDGETLGVVELEAELPLFDQGQSDRGAASAELLAAAAALRAAAHELAREVSLAEAAVSARARTLEAQVRPLAEQRVRIRQQTEAQFQAGEASYLELVGARRDEVKARADVLDAELQLATARSELARVLAAP